MSRDRMRNNYQRKFNKLIKILNKNIEKDELWKGRFFFIQKNASWWRFSDNSGGTLATYIRAIDKKTGYYHDYRVDYAPWMPFFIGHLTLDVVNDFIVNQTNVWKEDPRPTIDTTFNYQNTPISKDILNKKWNFWVPETYFSEWIKNN